MGTESWLQHTLETFLGAGVPVIFWMLENRRRARNEAHKESARIQQQLDEKHRENTRRLDNQDEKLDDIINERKYIPSHGHHETTGPLSAENIYPKR